MEEIKLTKNNLNKIIKWSPSRYNNFKKSEVVDLIIKGMNEGKLNDQEEYFFHSGSYCECSSMSRQAEYVVNFRNKTIVDCWTDEISEEPGYKISKINNEYKVIINADKIITDYQTFYKNTLKWYGSYIQ